MKRSGVLLMLLGLLLALVSGAGVYSLLQQKPVVTPTPQVTVKVVVAAQNIPERTLLQPAMLTVKDWPPDLAPLGYMSQIPDVVGKVTAAALAVGEPVLKSKVSIEQETIGLAPTLPPGLVAMTLAMSPVNAVGGALRSGDTVDIIVSLEYSTYDETGAESKAMQTTFYTIQDVPILGITAFGSAGTQQTGSTSSSSSMNLVTILVTPQDALLVKYAREKGAVDFLLRSPQFHDQVITDPVYLEYITRRFELPKPLLIRRQETTTGEPQ